MEVSLSLLYGRDGMRFANAIVGSLIGASFLTVNVWALSHTWGIVVGVFNVVGVSYVIAETIRRHRRQHHS